MRSARRVLLVATLSAAVVAVGANAAPDKNSIKDEMSTGGPRNQAVDAYCDLRSLDLKKSGQTLVVTARLRQFDPNSVYVFLYINTKGAARSKPEFFVFPDEPLKDRKVAAAGVYEPDSAGRPKAQATYTYKGSDLIFKVPLGALGASKTIGVQAGSCGRGGDHAQGDIAPGKYFYGDEEFDPATDHQYLPVDGTERVIEGRVVVSCAGARSCQRLPLKGVKVTARGPKTYRARTDFDGRFEVAVKKGVYEVSANAGIVRIKQNGKRVDVTKKSGEANFEACGFKGSSGASAARVPAGVWFGKDNAPCTNEVTMHWSASKDLLLTKWLSLPTCTRRVPGGFEPYGSNWGPVFPNQVPFKKDSFQITEDRITFQGKGKMELPPVGFLGSNGVGEFSATVQDDECKHSADRITLKHQKYD